MMRKWLRVLVAAAAVLLAPTAGAADGQNRIESFNVTQQGAKS